MLLTLFLAYDPFSGPHFIKFLNEYKTEIRARRGVRLSLLSSIAEGHFTNRLAYSQFLHLADFDVHSVVGRAGGLDGVLRDQYDFANRKIEKESGSGGKVLTNVSLEDLYLLGPVFGGGGLVPHVDEVPYLAEWREKQEQGKNEDIDGVERRADPS